MSKFPVRRDNYYHIGGRRYPAVTAITSIIAKPGLIPWAAKTAAAAVLADPERYDTAEKAAAAVVQARDDAAERGKFLHALVEQWAHGGGWPESVPEEHAGYASSFRAFIRSWPLEPIHSEVIVVNDTHNYAGRLDLIGRLNNETWLLDFKTSRAVWPEYGLQLVAYRHAEYFCLEPNMSLSPMVPVDHTGIVLIRPDGSFQLKRTDENFDDFLALRRAYDWLKRADD